MKKMKKYETQLLHKFWQKVVDEASERSEEYYANQKELEPVMSKLVETNTEYCGFKVWLQCETDYCGGSSHGLVEKFDAWCKLKPTEVTDQDTEKPTMEKIPLNSNECFVLRCLWGWMQHELELKCESVNPENMYKVMCEISRLKNRDVSEQMR